MAWNAHSLLLIMDVLVYFVRAVNTLKCLCFLLVYATFISSYSPDFVYLMIVMYLMACILLHALLMFMGLYFTKVCALFMYMGIKLLTLFRKCVEEIFFRRILPYAMSKHSKWCMTYHFSKAPCKEIPNWTKRNKIVKAITLY